jgi:RES domain-containing protein
MKVYRIAKGRYAEDLTGIGAEMYGGRWNSKGTKMVYTASSIALAMAEVAVHVPFGLLPKDYSVICLEVPADSMSVITGDDIKGVHWKSHPPSHITQKIGDTFVALNRALLLKVPSAVVQGDFNFLINPLHPKMAKVKILEVTAFEFDVRLFKTN